MHKIIVFDLDGTLCPPSFGMADSDIIKLRELEDAGYKIVICSGKPSYYLCGFMRQIGLRSPILIGENGATIQYGVALPPQKYIVHPHAKSIRAQREIIRALIDDACADKVWYQPNELALTPFPKDEETFDIIQKIIDDNKEKLSEFFVYRHKDSFDLSPKNISKYSALDILSKEENVPRDDFIAVGDGINDIPMFEFSDISLGINWTESRPVTLSFTSISDALDYLLQKRP